jgi:hypothetical protein
VPLALGIAKLLAQQQQPAAFGIEGSPLAAVLRQGPEAALALAQLGAMQFWIAPRQHQGGGAGRQRFIRQGRPPGQAATEGPQPFGQLWVAEMKGLVAGDRD